MLFDGKNHKGVWLNDDFNVLSGFVIHLPFFLPRNMCRLQDCRLNKISKDLFFPPNLEAAWEYRGHEPAYQRSKVQFSETHKAELDYDPSFPTLDELLTLTYGRELWTPPPSEGGGRGAVPSLRVRVDSEFPFVLFASLLYPHFFRVFRGSSSPYLLSNFFAVHSLYLAESIRGSS